MKIFQIDPNSSILRKITILLILSMLLGCAPQPAPLPGNTPTNPNPTEIPTIEPIELFEKYAVVGVSPGTFLEVYQEPTTESPLIGKIPSYGSEIHPTGDFHHEHSRTWIMVEYLAITGWINRSFVAKQVGNLPEDLILLGQQILEGLETRDYRSFESAIHPEYCLRFSPYSYIHPDNLILCPGDITDLISSNNSKTWGQYDGTGNPINLTFDQYHQRFVYDQNYKSAEVVGFNTEVSSGNSINNIAEIYPDGVMIEYYFPGFDPQYGGMDWRSLRLVFVPIEGQWYLAAIIHNEWTI